MNNRLKVLRPNATGHRPNWRIDWGCRGKPSTRLRKGKYDPSLTLAFKIASLFQQPIEDIFSPDEEDHNA